MALNLAFKTAIGMSLISMVAMEAAMNITDVVLTGEHFNLVGYSIYAIFWLCNPAPLQLLETKGTWKGMSLE